MAVEFDFDELSALARTNPPGFDRRCAEMIDQTCEALGGKGLPHIAGVLCRMELERRRSRSALQRCLRFSGLMWERLIDLDHMFKTGRPRRAPGCGENCQPLPLAGKGTNDEGKK